MMIDAHGHFGSSPSFYNLYPDFEAFVGRLDFLGIDKIILSHNRSLYGNAYARDAAEIEGFYERSAHKVHGYLVFNPHYPSLCLDLLQHYKSAPFFRGVKIHPSLHQTDGGGEPYRPVWEWAAREGVPILTHSWDKSDYNPVQSFSYPDVFETYVGEYPGVRLILGHSGGRPNGISRAIRLGRRYPNVYFDLAGDVYMRGLIETLCGQVGSGRILFGSDINWFDPSPQIAMVTNAEISPAEREDIFYRTAAGLFRF